MAYGVSTRPPTTGRPQWRALRRFGSTQLKRTNLHARRRHLALTGGSLPFDGSFGPAAFGTATTISLAGRLLVPLSLPELVMVPLCRY